MYIGNLIVQHFICSLEKISLFQAEAAGYQGALFLSLHLFIVESFLAYVQQMQY